MGGTFELFNKISEKLIWVALLCCTLSFAQNNSQQIKRVQRTIFIYNLAQQISGYTPTTKDKITIGVLGPDRTVIDLKVMAQKRTIAGKAVAVVAFQKVKDISDIDILYVNNKYNFDSTYILNSLIGNTILLITEDYKYNSSMINIVSVGNGFEYEINTSTLSQHNFEWVPSLSDNAISSAQKWKTLYKDAQDQLAIEQQENLEKQTRLNSKDTLLEYKNQVLDQTKDTIEEQQIKIKNTNQILTTQLDSIDVLWSLNKIQTQKFEDKITLEKELEKQIASQLIFLKEQQNQIKSTTAILEKQRNNLALQEKEINTQNLVLTTQAKQINKQHTILILLGVIAGLLLLSAFLFYTNNRKKKRVNKILAQKNIEIKNKSVALSFINKELEQFAYIASHDLKEPINTISSLVKMLDEDYGDEFNETVKQSFTFMTESSARMRELIDALLKHSKLGISQDRALTNCNTLLNTLQKDLNTLISKSGATITLKKLPVVFGSPIELRLVFQNLLVNAIKFSKKEETPVINISCKKITHSIDPQETFWQFCVADNGIGIAKKYQEKVFTIFQRLHGKEKYEGTGIGLAHTKKIITAHGGTIWIESEEGEGSKFYFTLPIKA